MKKLIYIVILITGIISIAGNCIAKGNKESANDYNIFSDSQVLLYQRETAEIAWHIYLIFKPLQKSYDLYDLILGSETGTYEQKGDTLYMTPLLGFGRSHANNKFAIKKLPDTLTLDPDNNLNIQKTFLIKNNGVQLIDLTTYHTVDINLVPKSFISYDKYFMIGSEFPEKYLKYAKKQLKNKTDK